MIILITEEMIRFFEEGRYRLLNKRLIKRWLQLAVANEGKILQDVNIVFCNDEELLEKNVKYLKHNTLTDIITFDYSIGDKLSGEIFISVERVKENALTLNVNFKDELCEDCQVRLEKNSLRVLDCKVDYKKDFFKKAPKLFDSLGKNSKDYFNKVIKTLEENNVSYELNFNLVRGLDYYNDVIFEIISNDNKSQNAILGGGRYDSLVESLGGPEVHSFGFGLGVERFSDLIKSLNNDVLNEYDRSADIFYMPLCEEAIPFAINSANKLRIAGLKCEVPVVVKNIKNNFKNAEKLNSIYAVIIGEDEIKNNKVKIKNLATKEEDIVMLKEFEDDILQGGHHE